MQWFQLRPTFEITINESRDEAIQKLSDAFRLADQSELFFMHGEYGELHLPKEQHRLWSPHLSFYITNRNELTVVFGRFAPRVDVWTSVWICYLLMAFTAFYGFTLAYSQWMLGHSPWGLWLGFVPMIAIATIYVVAHIGQQWSVDQMHLLRDRLETLLETARIRKDQLAAD